MGEPVFGNEFFDQWLNNKSNEILAKVEKDKLSTEDMLILSLKAQVNHFHHMDIEFREEFQKIDKNFQLIDLKFDAIDKKFDAIDKKFEAIDKKFDAIDKKFDAIDKKFDAIDKKFDAIDKKFDAIELRFQGVDEKFLGIEKRFDRLSSVLMWGFALFITTQLVLILKSFS